MTISLHKLPSGEAVEGTPYAYRMVVIDCRICCIQRTSMIMRNEGAIMLHPSHVSENLIYRGMQAMEEQGCPHAAEFRRIK